MTTQEKDARIDCLWDMVRDIEQHKLHLDDDDRATCGCVECRYQIAYRDGLVMAIRIIQKGP